MNKITKKFLGIVLSLGLLTTISFATQAKMNNINFANKSVGAVNYLYKNKGLQKNINYNIKFDNLGPIIQNDTSANEVVNYYIVMKKMFDKYDIPKENLEYIIPKTNANNNEIKLPGNLFTSFNSDKKNNFKNLVNNFNKNLKNIVITKQDFTNAKREIIEIIEKNIATFEETNQKYKNYDFNKKEDLIEIGRISVNDALKNLFDLKNTASNEFKGQIARSIKNFQNKLKNKKELQKEGVLVYERQIKPINEKYINNLNQHINQIKNVNYDDVINLTQDLKIIEKNLKIIDLKNN